MAAPKNGINLLQEARFEKSGWGKFLKWALTFGRWIVIFTELIVILAFLSRFKLDRDLTDLYEKIEQKQAYIESARSFEEEFRFIQKKVQVIKALKENQLNSESIILQLASLLPDDVYLENLSLEPGKMQLDAHALNEEGLRIFLNNLLASDSFSQIDLSTTTKQAQEAIKFSLSALITKDLSPSKESQNGLQI